MQKLPFAPFVEHKKPIIIVATTLVLIIIFIFMIQILTALATLKNLSSVLTPSKKTDINHYITTFVKQTISPQKAPTSLIPQPAKLYNGTTANTSLFDTSWKLTDGTIAHVITSYKKDVGNDYTFVLFSQPHLQTRITPASAPTITVDYFLLQPQGQWTCKTVTQKDNQNSTVCENFWTDSAQTKRGIGVVSNVSSRKPTSVFFCALPPWSTLSGWTSCGQSIGEFTR